MKSFLFETPCLRFLKLFQKLAYAYLLFFFLSLDWNLYLDLSPYLFEAPGLFGPLSITAPQSWLVTALLLALTLSGALSFFLPPSRLLRVLFFISAFLLDLFHNGFGFINAQIHLIWFCGLLCLADLEKETELNSLIFRVMELLVILVYFQSGIAKLVISGWDWAFDGTTLQIAWIRQETSLGLLFAQSALLAKLAALSALIFELAAPLYYLNTRMKRIFLATAILFHLGTWITMDIHFIHLWLFHISALSKVYPTHLQLPFFRERFSAWKGAL